MLKYLSLAAVSIVLFSAPILSATQAGAQGATEMSCRKLGKMKSKIGGTPITVKIKNATNNFRGVMWLNYQGQPVFYKNLNGGQSYVQQTYAGHPWMIVDGPGNCMQMFMPNAGTKVIRITR